VATFNRACVYRITYRDENRIDMQTHTGSHPNHSPITFDLFTAVQCVQRACHEVYMYRPGSSRFPFGVRTDRHTHLLTQLITIPTPRLAPGGVNASLVLTEIENFNRARLTHLLRLSLPSTLVAQVEHSVRYVCPEQNEIDVWRAGSRLG